MTLPDRDPDLAVTEAPRDQGESAFTPIMRRLLAAHPEIMTVCFVDGFGECVDYCSQIDPYDSKVLGAHMLVVLEQTAGRMRGLGTGQSVALTIHGAERDLIARRVDDAYLLVVGLRSRSLSQRIMGGIDLAAMELRAEAGIDTPRWDREVEAVRVEVREAVGWPYAPISFSIAGGPTVEISDVLGRWTAGDGLHLRTLFRVRTVAGEELTLVHDGKRDHWERAVDG